MKSKASRSRALAADSPLSLEALAQTKYEPPKARVPSAMEKFAGWNGIVFEKISANIKPKIGIQRVSSGKGAEAWLLHADTHYSLGLPVLDRKVLVRHKRKRSTTGASVIAEPAHFAWNARNYHAITTVVADKVKKDAAGKRDIPTDSTDALFFNGDNRSPYYPSEYPWHCIGRLEDAFGSPLGSGALVGRDLVLTARHCIPDTPNLPLKFVPAFYNGASTVGSSFFSWVKTVTSYEGTDYGAWDFALLRLYQPLGDHLGFFGVRTYNDDWDDLYVWAAAGYPSMSPYGNMLPSYLLGVAIDDKDDDGDASDLQSDNQDNSKGNSGGPLWAVWPKGPYIVGVTSANHHTDYGPFGDDYYVRNASGKAMVDLVSVAKLEIDTDIHLNPPHLNFGG